jgi:hypothetical protein
MHDESFSLKYLCPFLASYSLLWCYHRPLPAMFRNESSSTVWAVSPFLVLL